jgi:hypothetical protein
MTRLIRAFCDESSNGVFLMAAWVAAAETWESFADAWLEVLRQSPSIQYFKHYEAKNHCGQFEAWKDSDVDAKLLALSNVILKHKPIYGVTTGLITRKLKEDTSRSIVPRKKLRNLKAITEPYEFCFTNLICRVLQLQLEHNITERVDFIFDDHTLFGRCAGLYRDLGEKCLPIEQRSIAGTVSPACDKEVPALQAADLLAGQMTTSLRFGTHDVPLKMLSEAIRIYIAPCPLPRHMGVIELFESLNVLWVAQKNLQGQRTSRDKR